MSGSVRITGAGALATILASTALFPAFQEHGWFWAGVFATLFVCGVGFGLRQLNTPRILIPIGQLAALGWAFILVYARDGLYMGLLPTGESVQAFVDRLNSGMELVVRYAAPVPADDPALDMLIALGVGLVAVMVDSIAASLRMVPWAGLPLLLLYSIPATTLRGGVSPLAFIPAAIGYVVLLVCEGRDRLTRWGRVIGFADDLTGPKEGVQTSMLGQTGRRVGAAVIGLAVVVPAVLPTLPEGIFGTGPGSGQGGGGTTLRVNNPMVDLRRDLRMQQNFVVMTYTTNKPSDSEYIRLVVLDEFNGDSWRHGERPVEPLTDEPLPKPRGLGDEVERDTMRATFRIRDSLDSDWLPLFYPAQRVDVPGSWSFDPNTLDVLARDESKTKGLTYTETVLVPKLTPEKLREAPIAPQAIRQRYTRLTGIPKQIDRLARDLTKDAKTDYDKAIALQEWFRDEFVYSLEVRPGHGGSALLEFLKDRSGYCEQFAATMAIMARELGIPARVAVGYKEGTAVSGEKFEVRVKDAHAWPELYFAGYGWVRFEPTPATRADAPAWTLPNQSIDQLPTTGPSSRPTNRPEQDPRRNRNTAPAHTETDPTLGSGDLDGETRLDPVPFMIAGGVVLALAVPGGTRLLVRRRRLGYRDTAQLAEACWRELADTVRDLSLNWDDSATPRTVGNRLGPNLPSNAVDSLQRLVLAVERSRYAPDAGSGLQADRDLRASTRTVLKGLAAKSTWRRKIAARVLPRAFWARLRLLARPLTWALDGIDVLGGRLANLLRRRSR